MILFSLRNSLIKQLVVAILGSEEAAKPIITEIGDSLNYKINYTATMNTGFSCHDIRSEAIENLYRKIEYGS